MLSHRWRPVLFCVVAVMVIWVMAMSVFFIARNSKPTAEKVRAYAESIDLKKLSSAERARAIKKLAEKLNALPIEERRRAQMEQVAKEWFDQMTEEEKGTFLEATMPTGFKQMLAAFEELPEEKRRRTIEDTIKRLKETRAKILAGEANPDGTNGAPQISAELQAKIRTIGLKAFYSQSSAQTKTEMAPVLEELQRVMESGRPFRGR